MNIKRCAVFVLIILPLIGNTHAGQDKPSGMLLDNSSMSQVKLPAAGDIPNLLDQLEYYDNAVPYVFHKDLNGDGVEDFVIVSASSLCGTGGCPYALVDGKSMRKIGDFFGSPILISDQKINHYPVIQSYSHISTKNGVRSCNITFIIFQDLTPFFVHSLSKLSEQMRYPAFQSELRGTVEDGKRFRQSFGPGFEFVLEPSPAGWEIVVREQGRDENLARLTPPLHFAPNPREIEAWHVVDAPPSCPRSYDASTGPPFPREFIFSPEVGRTIAGPQTTRSITPEDAMAVQRFGCGKFTIERFEISYDGKACPHFKSLEFKVRLEGGY